MNEITSSSGLKSSFLKTVVDRGFIHQCTDASELDERCSNGTIAAYVGYDCTADSLHVGSLVSIMLLRHFQQSGHKPIVLMGGGTTRVGDPSGKDESRQLLSDEKIAENMASIKKIFEKFLTFGNGPTDAVMVNNADWLDKLNYIDLLRNYGRHFTINRMLSFESVKSRLDREQPLTFLEFNYMILQAYDFLELARRENCSLQMGGSDQWGNIVNGVELARRVDSESLFGLTVPLLTTASGAKMGKTASGAVWLNEDRASAYDYYQFWRNTEDADVGKFLRLFTELDETEVNKLEALPGAEINEAKKVLAFEATRLCRGEGEAVKAAETARQTFEQGQLAVDLPTVEMEKSLLEGEGQFAYEIFCTAGLTGSNGEARRLIKGGGGKVNDKGLPSDVAKITVADADTDGLIKLSAGKKRHVLLKLM